MVKIKELDCGIRVAMDKMPEVQSVSLGIWVHAGSAFENKRNAGVSHFIEHMMFKGTEKRSAQQIAHDVDAIGSQMNAFTGREATCYYIKTLSSNLDKSLEILLDMFTSSVFDENEMDRERKVIFEEMKMIRDTPDEDCQDTITEQVFGGTPLGSSIIGTESTLNGIHRSTIKNYISREYTRDSIVVAFAGNFDERHVCRLVENAFSEFAPEKPEYKYKKVKYEPSFRVKVKDIEQSHICMAAKSVPAGDKDFYNYAVFSNIMGGSMSSRLFQSIREQKGLAYTVYSMNNSFSKDGYFNIYAGVSHDKITEAVHGICEELRKFKKSGVTDEELAKAKEQLKSGYIFGLESVNSRMFQVGKDATVQNRIYTQEEIIEGVDAVTHDDLAKVARKLCDCSRYSAAAVTNRKIPLRRIVQG